VVIILFQERDPKRINTNNINNNSQAEAKVRDDKDNQQEQEKKESLKACDFASWWS